jgi:hypothetical protein
VTWVLAETKWASADRPTPRPHFLKLTSKKSSKAARARRALLERLAEEQHVGHALLLFTAGTDIVFFSIIGAPLVDPITCGPKATRSREFFTDITLLVRTVTKFDSFW